MTLGTIDINVCTIENNVDIPIFQTDQLSAGQQGMKFLPTKLKTIGINVHIIEIIVCLPILHLVFQAPQLSASQYWKRIMAGMKFPMQHDHGANKTMINMGKRH